VEDRIAWKLEPGWLAHQGLLDDLDVGFLDLDLDILEFRHGESRVGVVAGARARGAAAVTHATLAREDPALMSVAAPIVATAVAQKQPAAKKKAAKPAKPRELTPRKAKNKAARVKKKANPKKRQPKKK